MTSKSLQVNCTGWKDVFLLVGGRGSTVCVRPNSPKFTGLLPPSGACVCSGRRTGCGFSQCRENSESSARLTAWSTSISSALPAPVMSVVYAVGFLALLLGCLTVNACFEVTN